MKIINETTSVTLSFNLIVPQKFILQNPNIQQIQSRSQSNLTFYMKKISNVLLSSKLVQLLSVPLAIIYLICIFIK